MVAEHAAGEERASDRQESPPSSSHDPLSPIEAPFSPSPRPLPAASARATRPLPARIPELPERVAAELRLLAKEGRTEARILLHPPELGEVRVRLVQEAGGLSATIVADASFALDALAASAGALRRGLESLGIPVLALDVRAPGSGDAEEREADEESPPSPSPQRRREVAESEALIRATARIEGALIDVLA